MTKKIQYLHQPSLIRQISDITFSEPLYRDSTSTLTQRNGRIDKYLFEEGYCQAEAYSSTKDQFTFCYYDRDHLGSVRQVTEADGSKNGYVIQTANYYPFGGELCQGDTKNSIQSHKYNGKEFDNMYGLNTYDYGARQYNPVTGRWDRMDPLCEKYYPTSPFAYCMNNPVRLIDPDGRDPGDFFYSLDAAAKDFGKYTNPKSIKENREYATSFYKMTNNKGEKGFSYTKPRQGGTDGVSSWKFIFRDKKGNIKDSKSPTKEKAVATGHTHGAYKEYYGLGNDVFSGLKKRGKQNYKGPKPTKRHSG